MVIIFEVQKSYLTVEFFHDFFLSLER